MNKKTKKRFFNEVVERYQQAANNKYCILFDDLLTIEQFCPFVENHINY